MPDLDLAELDRLLFMPSEHNEATSPFMFMRKHWPSLRARIAELERKEKAFDAIADRKATIRDKRSGGWEVVFQFDPSLYLNDDLLTAISAAVAAKESKHEAD